MIILKSARSPKADKDIIGVDFEYQTQMALLRALEDAVQQNQEPAVLKEILDQLIRLAKAQFEAEELLMQRYDYPHCEVHIEEHEQVLARLQDMQNDYPWQHPELNRRLVVALKSRMTAHIHGPNRGLSDYLAERGLGAPAYRRGLLNVL